MAASSQNANRSLGLPPARTLGRFTNRWVAILNWKVVASGKNFSAVLAKGRRAGKGREPRMLHVPPADILLL